MYGLCLNGQQWYTEFSDDLRYIGFFSCKGDPGIWMRNYGEVWEYVAVYVHDLAFVVRDPAEFSKELRETY